MIKIDDDTLKQLGLDGLSEQEKQAAKSKIGGIFEDRYGDALMDKLNDTQLDEFEDYVIKVDPNGGVKWLEQNIPNYQEIMAEVFTGMMQEVKTGGLAVLDKRPAA